SVRIWDGTAVPRYFFPTARPAPGSDGFPRCCPKKRNPENCWIPDVFPDAAPYLFPDTPHRRRSAAGRRPAPGWSPWRLPLAPSVPVRSWWSGCSHPLFLRYIPPPRRSSAFPLLLKTPASDWYIQRHTPYTGASPLLFPRPYPPR